MPAGLSFKSLMDFQNATFAGHDFVPEWGRQGKKSVAPKTGERETHPLSCIFSKASKLHSFQNTASTLSSPFFTHQFKFLVSSPFAFSNKTMSVNAKASSRIMQRPKEASTATQVAVQKASNTEIQPLVDGFQTPNNPEFNNTSVMTEDQQDPVSLQTKIPAEDISMNSSSNPVPDVSDENKNNATEEEQKHKQRTPDDCTDTTMTCSKSSVEASCEMEDFEEERAHHLGMGVIESLGELAWNSLTPEQRPEVQQMLDVIQSRHLTASNKLRKELASKDTLLNAVRAEKAAQEKKTVDDFMSAVLKVVSQTTDAQTQSLLQETLDDLSKNPEATIAEKASTLLPFVAQAQLMTCKKTEEVIPKNTFVPIMKASQKKMLAPGGTQRPVGLEITANRDVHGSQQNQASQRSLKASAAMSTNPFPKSQQPPKKRARIDETSSSAPSLGFVFNSALSNPNGKQRHNKFFFD